MDSLGSNVNCAVFKQMKNKQQFIRGPEQYAAVAQEVVKAVEVMYVSNDYASSLDNICSDVLAFPDTCKTHCVHVVEYGVIEVTEYLSKHGMWHHLLLIPKASGKYTMAIAKGKCPVVYGHHLITGSLESALGRGRTIFGNSCLFTKLIKM